VLYVIYLLLQLTDLVFIKAFLLTAFVLKFYLHDLFLFTLFFLGFNFILDVCLLHLLL